MLGLFGLLKKNLELQGKLPAKWKDSTGFYDADGNIITDKSSKVVYLFAPPNENPNIDMTKVFSVQACSHCGDNLTTNFFIRFAISETEKYIGIQAVKGNGNNPYLKSRIGDSNLLSNTYLNWVNQILWLKMEWSPAASQWTSYYALSTSEPTAWTKHQVFMKNVGSQITGISIIGSSTGNDVDLTSIKVISGTSVILDGSSL